MAVLMRASCKSPTCLQQVTLLFLLTILVFSSFYTAHGQPPACSPPVVLRVCVPVKHEFTEFVSWAGTPLNATFHGFSVEVFENAVQHLNDVKQLSCELSYQYVPVGDGNSNPIYDDMIHNKECDAIVADVTITLERMKKVDFTQPYAKSALLVVVPLPYELSVWDFFRPFFVAILASSFIPRSLRWSDHLQESLVKRVPLFMPTSSGIFSFCQREIRTLCNLERSSTILCILLIASIYSTLSLPLSSEIRGLESLMNSNVSVGFQQGSFVGDYLTSLGIEKERLKPLASGTEFAKALRLGPKKGVAAIVDELPYVENFLASTSDFTTAGNQISYFGGFGFAFRKNSPYTDGVSMAIISLAQKGTLRRIHDHWIAGRIRK